MSEYSQGVCEDGAAVLKEGAQLTIEEILAALRRSEQQAAEIASAKGAMKVQSDGYMRLKSENEEQAAEIAEIRETSKHINKIRMKEEAELSRLKADYSELLYQVQQKIPGETRHETAKRIIRQHEVCRSDNSQQAKEDS